jgi:2-hydroxychromene-2-carboxylate isomerase
MTGFKSVVTFYFGVGSRYSYLAATQIAALSDRTEVTFQWQPIVSSALTVETKNSPFRWDENANDWQGARVSGQYREAYRRADLARWAAYYGVPYREPEPLAMEPTRRTLYAVAAVALGFGQVYVLALFDAIYARGLAVDEALCRDIATHLDQEPEELSQLIDSGEASRVHDGWVATAQRAGVFGVPSFVYDNDVYWGNDRLTLLEAALSD